MRAVSLFAAALPFCLTPMAAAQDELPEVALLHVEPCEGRDLAPAALRDRLRVELTSDGVRDVLLMEASDAAPTAATAGLAVIRVSGDACTTETATFRVTVEDRLTAKRVERLFDLTEADGTDRARVLALLIAELLRASWREISLDDPAPQVPTNVVEALRVRFRSGDDVSPSAATERAARAPRTAISAAFVVCALPGANVAPLGGRAVLDLAPAGSLVLRIDAEGVFGTSTHPLGAIDVGIVTLGLTAAWAASIDAVLVSIGPRVSGGVSWAAGRAADPTAVVASGAAAVLTLGGALELDVRLASEWSLRFGVEAAGVILGLEARVASIPAAGVYGAMLAVGTGIAFAP